MKRNLFVLIVMAVLTAFAVPARSEPLAVFVSVLPQKFFVEAIGGERVAVSVMVPPGASPATYEPRPQQMRELARARLYFAVGVPFEEAWLDRLGAANRSMAIIATEEGVEGRAMASHRHDHDHDGHAKTKRPGLDPHVWLSPRAVLTQGRNILRALVSADPEGGATYGENYRRFARDVVALDLELMERLRPLEGSSFMVFHPSWGYFADDYGLIQRAVEVEGKEPKAGELAALIDEVRREKIAVIFVQPQFSRKAAETLAQAAGAGVETLDPLAEDWDENLRRVAEALLSSRRP